jgi:hypothetical protein
MNEFSIQDAAFTGFRVVRQHPKALAAWAAYALVLSVVFSVIFVATMGRDVASLAPIPGEGPRPPAEVFAALGRLAPGYLLFMMVGVVSNSILGAAMIRAVLRPGEDRFGFLRLGGDELRQLGLGLLTFLLFLGVYIACVIVAALAEAVVAIAGQTTVLAGAVLVLLVIGILALMIFLAVRLSLAPAITFESGRINLFGSWALSRGRFWRLFATYLLAFALIVVVGLLSQLLILAIGALAGGNPLAPASAADFASPASYFTPARLVQTILGAGVSALIWPVAFTPPTAIYRRLTPSATFAADAFS